ncbi:MAG TPA: amidohydrolase [Algoriphagus sp.]|jgi:imidazolonepropionase-like amidohydrolase|uniref:amidohydrolase family protein n=1 Tax=unclassified Algoriphagus TaxID=2641541 RepID=UPI000C5BECC9|nr:MULTISPECIES: amidohydrolase family protein [unclassified Algoriphagus]MAL12709.1 amidohydrolase [Algoriphagus sp.]QYH38487.1 amidohydrolase family protein [Algoriphagus sp. NBT04N3]HAD52762.1 amidohydrolase [Algoriphagus sp.]HAS58203.1 amidohydrolase [Algoriphagus sp.]HAZ24568.1 amidohydrolase [Algoriphagus sp.]|tara:strand:- start:467 stop:1768 length:1302 start_codon:yes stop_codon:yes gene_type:complete
MQSIYKTFFAFLIALTPFMALAQIDGEFVKPRSGKFLLQNATVHTITKGVLSNTSVLIENGKIAQIGSSIQAADAEIIDCRGMVIYPGMIDSGTTLGLVEVNSVAETVDYQEIGNFTPNMQALTAVNPNSEAVPVTRVSGVTTVLSVPQGGLFPGTAALINLVGYTPDQMYAGFKAVVMNFPSSARRGRFDRRSDEDIKKDNEKAQKEANELWEKAKNYHELTSKGATLEYYPEIAQLAKVVAGELPLMIEVNAAADIQNAIKWVADKKAKVIFSGVDEGWRVADEIAKAGIPVLTGPVQDLPTRQSDRYDAAYANAGKMAKAGVKVALRTNDSENVRNLPFHAAFAAAYGLGKEEAWKAVTINPAEIFGLADQLGSVEVGKVANLIVSTEDPFETRAQIMHVFINGYRIPLSNRHIRLYQEFLERSPALKKN